VDAAEAKSYDIARLTLRGMIECGNELRNSCKNARCFEEAAAEIVSFLYERMANAETSQHSFVLARFYKTCLFRDLPFELQEFAARLVDSKPESDSLRCLTLLGSRGEEPDWNDIRKSRGHRAIPLPSDEFVGRLPMISNLINQLGIDVKTIIHGRNDIILDHEEKTFGVFHIPEAGGSPYIPAQDGFIKPFGIRSVIGFGGMITAKDMFAVILFSKDHISKARADLLAPLALSIKNALIPFAYGRLFKDGNQPHAGYFNDTLEVVKLHSKLATTEQLLCTSERIALEQFEKLETNLNKLKSAEETLVQCDKFAALGEMAGGIAHEINNPVSIIHTLSGQISEALASSPADIEFAKSRIADIEKQSLRISKIIAGLRSFSRDASGDGFVKAGLDAIINETLSLCSSRFKHNKVETRYSACNEQVKIECRPSEIIQVLLNLLNNAFDAVVVTEGGWIDISVAPGMNKVVISISDSGNGIPEQVAGRIFQPFFTTKPVGKGTGLGLSISKGIVETHGGTISLDRKCLNTKFDISLPFKQPGS